MKPLFLGNKMKNTFNNAAYQEKLKRLQTIIVDRFDTIVGEFDLNLTETYNLWLGPCPIHGGSDNPTAFNFYKDGYDIEGYWRCNTHNCSSLLHNNKKIFAPNSIGLVRALLSVRENDWATPGDQVYGFKETIQFLEKLFKISTNDFKVDYEELIKDQLLKESSHYSKENKPKNHLNLDVSYVKEKLEIPSQYFIDRGFSSDILKKYYVGLCKSPKSPMYNRAVCPIFDEDGKTVIGLTGRSVYDKCEKCSNYHDKTSGCDYNNSSIKWWNIGSFKSSHLYNYWNAKKHINKTKVALIVEGQGDVWKLVESGIHNCVGIFGVSLSDEQQFLLEKAGTMGVIPLFDNPKTDKAGEIAYKQFTEKCGSIFRIYTIKDIYGDTKDVGDFNNEQIQKLKEFITKVERIYQ